MRAIIISWTMLSWMNVLFAAQQLPLTDTTNLIKEIVMDAKNAPITVIEYSSLNCVTCAAFHKTTLPKIIKNYVDTGKVRFIFRHYPLNDQAAQVAAVISSASPCFQTTYIERVFEDQGIWMKAPDLAQKLADIMSMPVDACRAAMNDKKLTAAIYQSRFDADKKYNIEGTPTFIINDKVFDKDPSYENFEEKFKTELMLIKPGA